MAMTRLELTTRLAMGPMPGQQSIRDPSAWVISSSRLALADSLAQRGPQGNKRKYVEQSDCGLVESSSSSFSRGRRLS